MPSALSPYWSPEHRRPQDYDFIRTMAPAVVKIMDGGRPDYDFARSLSHQPLIIARDWAISEQKHDMLIDPVGTAQRHLDFWVAKAGELGLIGSNTLILGINEPAIWEPGVTESLTTYTIELCDRAAALGMRVGALNLSVGWPNNTGEGTPPDWSIFPGVEAAIKRGNHALVLHEYWADLGPEEMWGWWGGRFMKCPWQVPIVIGECGIEMMVKYGSQGHQGWNGRVSAQRYAEELARYVAKCVTDKRFFAATVFEQDFKSHEWGSFDIEPAFTPIISTCRGISANPWFTGQTTPPEPLPEPPAIKIALPLPVGSYHITQRFYQNPKNYQIFGLPGHNGTDLGSPIGTSVMAISEGVVEWVDEDRDYGLYVRIYHPTLNCHSFYAHLSKQLVKKGDKVKAGYRIGLVGSTGNSTGPHLHFEIRLGGANADYSPHTPMARGRVDPESWMAMYGLKF